MIAIHLFNLIFRFGRLNISPLQQPCFKISHINQKPKLSYRICIQFDRNRLEHYKWKVLGVVQSRQQFLQIARCFVSSQRHEDPNAFLLLLHIVRVVCASSTEFLLASIIHRVVLPQPSISAALPSTPLSQKPALDKKQCSPIGFLNQVSKRNTHITACASNSVNHFREMRINDHRDNSHRSFARNLRPNTSHLHPRYFPLHSSQIAKLHRLPYRRNLSLAYLYR